MNARDPSALLIVICLLMADLITTCVASKDLNVLPTAICFSCTLCAMQDEAF